MLQEVSKIGAEASHQNLCPLQGYLPGQLYNLNSKYGNKEELQALLKAFKEAGVVTVADIVINHRCADAQDDNGVWNTFKCAPGLLTASCWGMLAC